MLSKSGRRIMRSWHSCLLWSAISWRGFLKVLISVSPMNLTETKHAFYVQRYKTDIFNEVSQPPSKWCFYIMVIASPVNSTFLLTCNMIYIYYSSNVEIFIDFLYLNKLIIDIRTKFCIYARRAFRLQKTRQWRFNPNWLKRPKYKVEELWKPKLSIWPYQW